MQKRRVLSIITALALTFGSAPLTPANVFAADPVPVPAYTYQDGDADVGTRMNDLLNELTLDEKIAMEQGAPAVNRLGLNGRRSSGGEALHGVVNSGFANAGTVFPSSFGLSQSFDEDLMYKIGDAIAKESQATGNIGRLAPVLDLLRDPRYGRAYETLGEDAYLTGSLGTAFAGGMNQRDPSSGYQQFIPILKHVLGYNVEVNRLWINSVLTPRNLEEYYEKVFRYTVEGGVAKSLMNSYPLINGKPMSVHPVQHDLLFDWTPNYPGTNHYEYNTTNDYGSGSSLFVHSQRYFADDPNGRALGVSEGIQNGQMGWSFRNYGGASGVIYDALARGILTEDQLNDNVKRSIAMSLRMGDYDQFGIKSPYVAQAKTSLADRVKDNKALAFRAAQEQIVLLKNDGVLPLSGAAVTEVALIGPLADQVLKDHYTGPFPYDISIKDALENKLGSTNVKFTRAVDTIAIKASNGKYLVNPPLDKTAGGYSAPGAATTRQAIITAVGDATNIPTLTDTDMLYEWHEYAENANLLRTPNNNLYVQVTSNNDAPAGRKLTMMNNTSSPGEARLDTGRTSYVLYQNFRIVKTDQSGKYGLYNMVAGNGGNNPNPAAKAYDADDEDLNHGSYLKLDAGGAIVADLNTTGPFRNEVHTSGPSITSGVQGSKVDSDGTDDVIDNLPVADMFEIDYVQDSEAAIDAAMTGLDPAAPVILVLGYEPHLNAKEASDLHKTGLSSQQVKIIDHVTGTLNRDVILIVKTGNPMVIGSDVVNNAKIKAILEIGHTSQEEGSAIVSALFDNGYSVPNSGFSPAQYNYSPYITYAAIGYPGYTGGQGKGYSPSGRLSATWYNSINDMIGASEDHPPASYEYPDYDEVTNDNQSNMNGTINTGLNIYDIVKGERTYMYYNGTPLFPFGYGLTYTDFTYSPLTIGAPALKNDKNPEKTGQKYYFTVSGTVTNNGTKASDAVVQIYSQYKGSASRIVQPNNRLIAYKRILNIAPGSSEPFDFEVDLSDKLGVLDVETGTRIVEPGDYEIKLMDSLSVANTSYTIDAIESKTLNVTTANGGTAASQRNLSKLQLAWNFDDYSNVGGRVYDIELISASADYDSNTAVQFRKNNAWIVYKDVNFSTAPSKLTAQLGSDRNGVMEVYAVPAGTALTDQDPTVGTKIATFNLTDTRSKPGIATGLGIGPIAANPGSIQGQALADNYIKPEWKKYSSAVSGISAGTAYDIYFLVDNRGAQIEWFQFGAPEDATSVEISQQYSQDSIRSKGGSLILKADLKPLTATSAVTWSVTAVDGSATALATIVPSSVVGSTATLTAAGTTNGAVVVKATTANGKEDTMTIKITNQLDRNKVNVGTAAAPVLRTVEYILLRTGDAFGQNDNIRIYKGTNQQNAVYSPLYSEVASNYYDPTIFSSAASATTQSARIPGDQLIWSVTNMDGSATSLAAISNTGNLTAAGIANGKVKVKAVLKTNPDVTAERVIVLENQAPRDVTSKIYQAELYDRATGMGAPTATYVATGNEFGLATTANLTTTAAAVYYNVDFKYSDLFYLRYTATEAASVEIWIDGQDAASKGTKVGTLSLTKASAAGTYDRGKATLDVPVSGIHDLYLVFKGTAGTVGSNWFQFMSTGTPPASFNVTFDANGGAWGTTRGSITVPVVGQLTTTSGILPGYPLLALHKFNGWWTDKTAGTKIEWPVTKAGIYYAHWQIEAGGWVRPPGNSSTPSTSTPATPETPSTTSGAVTPIPEQPSGTGTGSISGFSDASSISSWAAPFIEKLVQAGVLSGYSDGTLKPQGNITRAEFTKMIVSGLKLTAGGTAKSFPDDVKVGDWYKEFVDIASANNIVNGVSATGFAPNANISRQDLAAIAYRALIYLNATIPAPSASKFSDDGSIADYAKDAVYVLRELAIVGGRTDGSFDPLAFATREETAKIICGVMDHAAASTASQAPVIDATAPSDATAPEDTASGAAITSDAAISAKK